MTYDKQTYNNAYNKNKYVGVSFRISTSADQDIIDALKEQENVKAYICKLIRSDQKRRARRRGIIHGSDRSTARNYKKFPYEVLEDLPGCDHYTVGFTSDYDSAVMMAAEYASRTEGCGRLRIMCRTYDQTLNAVTAVEVSE